MAASVGCWENGVLGGHDGGSVSLSTCPVFPLHLASPELHPSMMNGNLVSPLFS